MNILTPSNVARLAAFMGDGPAAIEERLVQEWGVDPEQASELAQAEVCVAQDRAARAAETNLTRRNL